MSRCPIRRTLAGLLTLLLAWPVAASDANDAERGFVLADAKAATTEPAENEPESVTSAPPATPVVYRPPRRGSARTRIGGGTRGISKTPHIQVLAPDHVGLTTRSQPVLAWFLEHETDQRIDFTLTRRDVIEPVVEKTLPVATRAGVQLIALEDFGVELEPGAVYEWSIAVVVDPEERDRDVFRGGAIERQSESAALTQAVSSMDAHRAFAMHGIWYDAIADLSRSIGEQGSTALTLERAALLDQVDLEEVARFERARIASR